MPLKVEDLRVSFRFERGVISRPVRGVSFEVPDRARVALVGESGCGKSLTALAIGGLVDRAEISGNIERPARIAYVFQNPMQSLNPVMKVGAQIREGQESRSRSEVKVGRRSRLKVKVKSGGLIPHSTNYQLPTTNSARVKNDCAVQDVGELLEAVGLPKGTERKYPCELSGGQQQRVMIAMALAQEPELLIADEPTTALDVTTQKEVLELIDRLADERGMAVLLITHNLGLVAEHCEFVNVMYAGEIVESGPVAEVLSHPRHPYTRGLLAAVPRLDAPKDAPLADIRGTVPPPTAWPTGCAFHPRCDSATAACSAPDFRCPFTSA